MLPVPGQYLDDCLAIMTTDQSSLLTRTAQGVKVQLLLQLATRGLTFLVNQTILRFLSPELLGVATQLEVYSISILFFAREALRVALLRQPDDPADSSELTNSEPDRERANRGLQKSRKAQSTVNLAYVSILLGFLTGPLFHQLYLRSLRNQSSVLAIPHFRVALVLYSIATFLELLVEPMYVIVQQKVQYKIRAAAESAATVSKCISTCGLTLLASRNGLDIGVLPFAVGQCVYAAALFLAYFFPVNSIAASQGFSLLPRAVSSRCISIKVSRLSGC